MSGAQVNLNAQVLMRKISPKLWLKRGKIIRYRFSRIYKALAI